ncbi:MAG: restriction endonuclease subunit S [Sulfuricurvum sp.]|nr:restriction endonuclease subunit S [Sulfuricurvum sp.]
MSLPKGWVSTNLRNLISADGLIGDGDWIESKDQDIEGNIRLIQLADIGDGIFKDKSYRFINEDAFERLNCLEILEGDILIARLPDPLGRACIFPSLSQKCITVVDICIIRPGSELINIKWLCYFINAPQTREYIELNSSGVTRKRISRKKLEQYNIHLPPLNEQKRIAEKLDTLLASVYAIKKRLDNATNIIKRFRQSVLAAATSGKLTEEWKNESNATEWCEAIIKDFTTKVGSGSTPKGGESAYKESGIPLIRSMNIHFEGIKYKKLAFIDESQAKKLSNVIVEENDVLLNITGASIGRVALAPNDLVGARVNQHVSIIRTISDMILPEYLNIYLASPITQSWIQDENYGGTREALTKEMILNYTVKKPSNNEQIEIVSRVESLFSVADAFEAKIEAASKQVDKLTQSILAKAFKGELVSQEPMDEPADKLLEDIQSQQQRVKPEKKASNAKKISFDCTSIENVSSFLVKKFNTQKFTLEDLYLLTKCDIKKLNKFIFELLKNKTFMVNSATYEINTLWIENQQMLNIREIL